MSRAQSRKGAEFSANNLLQNTSPKRLWIFENNGHHPSLGRVVSEERASGEGAVP